MNMALRQDISNFVPSVRTCPFEPPAMFTEARDEGAPRQVTIWDGSRPWLITTHAQVQQVLRDPRFGSDVTDPNFPNTSSIQPRSEGNLFFRKDGPPHMDVRRLLNPSFTPKAAEKWRPRIAELIDESIDAMLAGPRPVDAIANFALVVPTVVICELLGVDQSESHTIHESMGVLIDTAVAMEAKLPHIEGMEALLRRHAEAKRGKPDGTLLSTLVNDHAANGTLTMEEVARLGTTIIGAGHETTANMLGLATLALIRDPEQRQILLADPKEVAPTATEEMLRYWSIVQSEPRRVATADVEIGGQLIRAGEGVVCALAAANRDPAVFDDADDLDLTRKNRTHVAFGFGLHQCVGQNLSRVELQEAMPRLFQRIPDLRLAVPEADLRFTDTKVTYGLVELPVTWGDQS